jgi:hypothetical protein
LTKGPFLYRRLSNLSRAACLTNSQQRKRFGVRDELCAFVVRLDAFKRQADFEIALGSEAPRKRDRSKGIAGEVKMSAVSGACAWVQYLGCNRE